MITKQYPQERSLLEVVELLHKHGLRMELYFNPDETEKPIDGLGGDILTVKLSGAAHDRIPGGFKLEVFPNDPKMEAMLGIALEEGIKEVLKRKVVHLGHKLPADE